MVILATKVYGTDTAPALQSLEAIVEHQIGELTVDYAVGVRHDGFPSVTLEGEDATAARNHLAAQWGEITGSFEEARTYWGVLDGWSADGFVVDAGEPLLIPEDRLGLGGGTPEQVATRFGLVQHVPIRFTFGDPPALADAERDRLFGWRRGPGRVTANATTRSQLRATVNRAGHADDIETIERLGLLEQSIICRMGTDPPGLVATIGPHVPGDLACVVT